MDFFRTSYRGLELVGLGLNERMYYGILESGIFVTSPTACVEHNGDGNKVL